jgi:hypothetical protein
VCRRIEAPCAQPTPCGPKSTGSEATPKRIRSGVSEASSTARYGPIPPGLRRLRSEPDVPSAKGFPYRRECSTDLPSPLRSQRSALQSRPQSGNKTPPASLVETSISGSRNAASHTGWRSAGHHSRTHSGTRQALREPLVEFCEWLPRRYPDLPKCKAQATR